eukprot:3063929-Pyramimonas_sp.AAC.1
MHGGRGATLLLALFCVIISVYTPVIVGGARVIEAPAARYVEDVAKEHHAVGLKPPFFSPFL